MNKLIIKLNTWAYVNYMAARPNSFAEWFYGLIEDVTFVLQRR